MVTAAFKKYMRQRAAGTVPKVSQATTAEARKAFDAWRRSRGGKSGQSLAAYKKWRRQRAAGTAPKISSAMKAKADKAFGAWKKRTGSTTSARGIRARRPSPAPAPRRVTQRPTSRSTQKRKRGSNGMEEKALCHESCSEDYMKTPSAKCNTDCIKKVRNRSPAERMAESTKIRKCRAGCAKYPRSSRAERSAGYKKLSQCRKSCRSEKDAFKRSKCSRKCYQSLSQSSKRGKCYWGCRELGAYNQCRKVCKTDTEEHYSAGMKRSSCFRKCHSDYRKSPHGRCLSKCSSHRRSRAGYMKYRKCSMICRKIRRPSATERKAAYAERTTCNKKCLGIKSSYSRGKCSRGCWKSYQKSSKQGRCFMGCQAKRPYEICKRRCDSTSSGGLFGNMISEA